eukprot:gi/632990298/ref/XP_007884104.1/ PREDICTED: myc proto-oncogene protein-like [Callorhinchus milii]
MLGCFSLSLIEEEIDVVTLGKGQHGSVETHSQTLAAIQRCNLHIQQQHNYAAPAPSSALPPPPAPQDREPPRKRARAEAGSGGQQSTGTADIGGEEEERRRTHNVLERQRRNELKVCLTALRDQVPELAHNHKASKVLILRQAAQHISRLQTQQHRLSREQQRLHHKQERLRLKLHRIRTRTAL